MNLKTTVAALSVALLPATLKAETAVKHVKKPLIEKMSTPTKTTGVYGKALVKNSIKHPPIKSVPKPEMANLRVIKADHTQVQYDSYGNISAMFNTKGKKLKEISRDENGKLQGYTDISYKNGAKNKETLYYVDSETDKIVKYAEHSYNGNGTATVTLFDGGNVSAKSLYETSVIKGEEIIPESGFIKDIE